jgi:O-antigen/teichoic acid export membrane protein
LALSNLVGGGVQTALPLLVVYQIGDDGAGLLRAASLLAFQSVGFLMTGLSQDFFPRISEVRRDPAAIIAMLWKQFSLMIALAIMATASLTALGPWLLKLCFSDQFTEATRLLDLLAIGMIFKMGSWCLAYVVLARCSSRTYLITEGVTGLVWLSSSVVLMSVCGVNGIGYAFVLTYVIYFILVSTIVSRNLQSVLPWKMLLGSLAATAPVMGVIGLRSIFGAVL